MNVINAFICISIKPFSFYIIGVCTNVGYYFAFITSDVYFH